MAERIGHVAKRLHLGFEIDDVFHDDAFDVAGGAAGITPQGHELPYLFD